MERAEWLKQEREKTEKLCTLWGLYAPREELVGSYESETHLEYLRRFLERIPPHSAVLSAGCGAGRNDEILLEAGHCVLGIDQAEGLLTRAREFFPEARYEKIGLQEMDFSEEFDGITCIDAIEHVCPEDWPGIVHNFREALKPGGVLYITTCIGEEGSSKKAYERLKSLGVQAVSGEMLYFAEEDYERDLARGENVQPEDYTVYIHYPPLEKVREWINQAGLRIEEEETGPWNTGKHIYQYEHFIITKK